MRIKELLKSNDALRRIVKKLKIYREYLCDARDFSRYYMESAEHSGDSRYRIMLLVHSLEKGMCMPELRPFGHKKARQLMQILSQAERKSGIEFEYDLGISTLSAWVSFFEEHGWEHDEVIEKAKAFVKEKEIPYAPGRKTYLIPRQILEEGRFTDVMLSRHSVRDYEERELEQDDVAYALTMFVGAPSACNRQMCKVYQVKNKEAKELLDRTVMGVGGFNIAALHYFIITYDIAAFEFFGERNQGYLNAGLAAMNFANGLHACGIGSCFLQWANKRSEDKKIRQVLSIGRSERIAVVLGAGYYKEESSIPCSCRRTPDDIYRVVE